MTKERMMLKLYCASEQLHDVLEAEGRDFDLDFHVWTRLTDAEIYIKNIIKEELAKDDEIQPKGNH